MGKGGLAAAIVISAFAILVSTYMLGFWGIPIAAGIAYFVFRKRGSKTVRTIAFAIGVMMVIGGAAWLSFDIINNMLL